MERGTEPEPPVALAERVQWLGLSFSRRDQPFVMFLCIVCFAAMAGYYWHRAVQLDGLIDIDRLPKRVATFQVDINRAPWPEIANLPGIGPHLAAAIVEHRQNHGPFPSLVAVKDVSGIGDVKYRKMLPHMWISDDSVSHDLVPTSRR